MKIRVERDVLADAVAWAARTLPSRPSNPILAGLLVDATGGDGSLILSAFDHEVSSRGTVTADVVTPGRALVSGRLLADIAKSLSSQPVSLALSGSRLEISCGRSTFTLPTFDVDGYPRLPDMPEPSGTIDGATFASAVASVAVAAGKDETLTALTGIRLEIDGSTVTLAATDRYRLAVREFEWTPAKGRQSLAILVPARTLEGAAKSLASAGRVTIAVASGGSGEGLVGFEGDGRRTTSRLIEQDFPKYRTLLPDTTASAADVSTSEMVEAVKRVSLVAERNTSVLLSFSNGEVLLRAGSGEEARAQESLECALEGDDIEIAFNPEYLLAGLAAVDSPTTRMRFTVAQKPAILVGVADGTVRTDYRYLLMPIRLAAGSSGA